MWAATPVGGRDSQPNALRPKAHPPSGRLASARLEHALRVAQEVASDPADATPAPRGTYFVRVRAANAFGLSPPTNEVVVVVP